MGRGTSASFVAALALAAALAGCGGHSGKPSASTTRRGSSTAAPAPAPTTTATRAVSSYWPYAKVVASLAGRTITLANATVRLDSALLECNGQGVPSHTGATRAWSRYTCTQTLFQGGVDHDITFDVTISSPTELRIESPRNGPA